MRLTILVKGGYFGEWNLSNISQEYTAIVYSTEVILLSITREAFKSLIKDKTDFQDFEKNLQEKKIWRKSFLSKIVDSRENSIEKSFVLENSQTKLKKDDLNFNEYYGSEALPNYFLQNLSPCKGPQGKVLTSLAVGKKPHHSTGRIQTNEKSSSVSIALDNNIMKQGFPHKNKCKELSPSISSKIFSPSFMKKLSDEHPVYSRQRRRLANAPLKNRRETSSSKRTLSRTEQNDKNLYFEKIMTEPSRIYQFEPSNYSSSFFLSNNNTKVNTPAISSKDRKLNVYQDEEKFEAQNTKFKIMKLKLDKIYQNKELSWNGLKTLSYRSPLNNEELLPQRNYEKSTNINEPDINKFRQTWSQLQNKETPKTLNIPQQRGSFSFQSKKIIKCNGSHSHRE